LAQHLAPPPLGEPDSFAAVCGARPVERVGGGYETDVFRSGDRRLALKLKHAAGTPAVALARARRLREAAERFCAFLGPAHSLPSDYLVVGAPGGACRVLAVQPFLDGAHALDTLDLAALPPEPRAAVAAQLAAVVAGAEACYRATGTLPDLYGLGPHDAARARRWDLRWAIGAARHLLAGRPLIEAHNLLLAADGRVVLVDYDLICHGWLGCRLVYGVRALLLRRDRRDVAGLAGGR
jgi:hypothetical protein